MRISLAGSIDVPFSFYWYDGAIRHHQQAGRITRALMIGMLMSIGHRYVTSVSTADLLLSGGRPGRAMSNSARHHGVPVADVVGFLRQEFVDNAGLRFTAAPAAALAARTERDPRIQQPGARAPRPKATEPPKSRVRLRKHRAL